MSTLIFTILDLDFPVGSKNKTATLVTSEREALLVDAGFTRADGYRLAAAVLDSGKTLAAVFISHGDPDFYIGAEVIADTFPARRSSPPRRSSPTSSTHTRASSRRGRHWAPTCPPGWLNLPRWPET